MSSSVLIVDGDPTFAEAAQQALQAAGIATHVRFDASLEELRTLRPRVLMLSAELPRGSGFGICSRIRRDKGLRDLCILMTTDEAPPEAIARHARSAEPADDYVRKDVPLPALVDRVGRLLAQAPTLLVAEKLVGPTTERLTPVPPPLPRSDSAAPLQPRPASSTGARPTSGTAQLLELWPRDSYESELLMALAPNDVDPLPKGRATPEERLTHLRQQVKQHEAKEKTVRQLWQQVVQRGQELAGRIVTLSAELEEHRGALAEARQRRQEASKQREAIRSEFQTFEDEIRRVFSEKDEEERTLKAEVQALRASQAELGKALASAKEQAIDDGRRLSFLQEELDALTVEKERAAQDADEAVSRLAAAEKQARDLTARLETAEHVAGERAEALESLREQLDQLTYEREQGEAARRKKDEQARRVERESHARALAEAGARHQAQVRAAAEQHEEALRAQSQRFEERFQAVARARAQVQGERDDLRKDLAQARSALDVARAEVVQVRRAFQIRLTDTHRAHAAALAVAQAQAAELRESLARAHADGEARTERLEDKVERQQEELLDLAAALDQERADREALGTEHQRALQELRTQRTRLENRIREGDALLEAARRRLVDTDETARRRQSELQALTDRLDAQRAELDEAQQVQQDLEAQVTRLAHERSARDQALASSRARGNDERSKLEAALRSAQLAADKAKDARRQLLSQNTRLGEQLEAQQEQLNEARFATESIRNALDALARDLERERQRPSSPRITALLDRLDRVASMSRDALQGLAGPSDGERGRATQTDGGPTSPFPDGLDDIPILVDDGALAPRRGGSALTFNEAFSLDETNRDLADPFGAPGLRAEPTDDEGNTEIIDLEAVK